MQSLFAGYRTGSDSATQLGAMAESGTVFAIVSRIAESTAATRWDLVKPAPNGKGEPTPVPKHPALDLLRAPNPFMSGRDILEGVQQHIELTGEGYFVVYRGARTGLPVELWPVRPDRMSPVPGTDGVFLRGWMYSSPDGETVPLDVNDVIQIRKPDPTDPFRGLSALRSSMSDIQAAKLAAEWNRNFFLNSATPGGIIEVEEALSDTEWRQMVDRWGEQHQGVAQAHRVAILEKGKWIDRNYSMKDMQFAEMRNLPREILREAFGFPKPLLGAVDDVNRANAEAAEAVFAKWLIVPRLERIKAALDTRLLPMFGPLGEGVEFVYESPVPEDEDAENAERLNKAQAAALLADAGWNADDVLETVGLPSMRFVGKPAAPAPTALPAPAPQTPPSASGAPDGHEADQEDADGAQGVESPTATSGGHA